MTAANPLSPLPLAAFCILCRDMDTQLEFYTETLSLEMKRREESFIAFDTLGITICLWEIRHVADHLNVPLRPEGFEPVKACIVLDVPEIVFSSLSQRLQQNGIKLRVSAEGHHFTDHHATDWLLRRDDSIQANVSGFTLYVSDLETSAAFYETQLGCTPTTGIDGNIRFNCANGTYFELSSAQGCDDKSCNTMIALGFENRTTMIEAVERLNHTGVIFHSPPQSHEWGFDAGYFTDPDGHVWELYATEREL